ncbi:MAG: hypothetical protein AAF928_04885 [Myxococcota bacterium]
MMAWRPLGCVVLLVAAGCGADDDDVGEGGDAPSGVGGSDAAQTTSVAGAGGGAGQGGRAGSGSGGGGGGATGSEGCGVTNADDVETWVAKTLTSGGVTREYFVWLPAGYDPATPYPVVYQFHGCSGNPNKENNNPPVQAQSGADAIHVRGRAVANCWDTAAGGADVLFFDDLVAAIESEVCADPKRRFATGYSSGAFMSHRLACERGDVLRGVATIAGGSAGTGCVGRVAALLIHDERDGTVNISTSEAARDRHLENNGCDAMAPPTPGDRPPCEAYAGCDEGWPVVWCATTGQNHARQDGLSAPAFWAFLSTL